LRPGEKGGSGVISLYDGDRAATGFCQRVVSLRKRKVGKGIMGRIGLVRISSFSIFLFAVFVQNCGYRFQGSATDLTPDIQSLAIPIFANHTIQTGIESEVTRALIEKFISSKRLSVTDSQKADAQILGTVLSFATSAVAVTSSTQVTTEYRATLTLGISLQRKRDGKILFREEIAEWRNYPVVEDLTTTENNKLQAIRQISVLLAERIHDFILLNF